jgi:hypothetical protein
MSLIAVLITIAIVGIMATIFMGLFGNITGLVLRKGLTADVENMTLYIQNIMGTPDTADYALRSPPIPTARGPGTIGNPVVWNFRALSRGANCAAWIGPTNTCADVDHIEIFPNGGINEITGLPNGTSAALALYTGQVLSTDLQVTGMYIRQPDPSKGETPVVTMTVVRLFDSTTGLQCNVASATCTPHTFDTTTAKLVLRFGVPAGQKVTGGSFNERTVDTNVAVDRDTNQINFCYQTKHVKSIDMRCNGENLYPGQPDCPPNAKPCRSLYYVDGFDSLGRAICKCQVTCDQGGGGAAAAPGAGPAAGPAPGPAAGPAPGPSPKKKGAPGAGPGAAPGAGPAGATSPGGGAAPGAGGGN